MSIPGRPSVRRRGQLNFNLERLESLGEDPEEYAGLCGYDLGVTEPRPPLFELPADEFAVTREFTHLDLGDAVEGGPTKIFKQSA